MKNHFDFIALLDTLLGIQSQIMYVLILLALICLSNFLPSNVVAGGLSCDSGSLTTKDMMPENSMGYERPTSPEFFETKDLYDYLNGGADRFRDNGLVCLMVQYYTKGANTVTLEIYHFITKAQALRFYEEESEFNLISHAQKANDSKPRMVIRLIGDSVLRCFSSESKDAALFIPALVDAAAQKIEEPVKEVGLSAQMDPKKKNGSIVIIGASYAEGWPVSQINDKPVVNKGGYGEKTAEMLARFQRDVIDLNPESVIIWGFINDIFDANRSRIDTVLHQTRANLREMVSMAQASGIEPILATEVTIRPQSGLKEAVLGFIGKLLGKQSYQDYVNQKVTTINDWIKTYAVTNQIRLLDLQPLLADENGARAKKYAAPDGSHISPAGYNVMTRYAEHELQSE